MPYYCTLDAYSQHSQGRRGVFLSFSLSSGWPPPFSLNQPCACCTSQHERRLRGAAGSWDRPAVFSKIFQKFACVNRDLPCQNLPLLRKKSPPTPTRGRRKPGRTAAPRGPRAPPAPAPAPSSAPLVFSVFSIAAFSFDFESVVFACSLV